MLNREQRELVKVLSGFAVFAECDADDLGALVRAGRVSSLPARWTFVHEGTPADAVYVLLEGQAKVRLAGADVAVVEPGAVIGEMALLTRRLRTASIVAVSGVQTLRVEYSDLVRLLGAHPRLAEVLGAALDEHRAADRHRAPDAGAMGAPAGGT